MRSSNGRARFTLLAQFSIFFSLLAQCSTLFPGVTTNKSSS